MWSISLSFSDLQKIGGKVSHFHPKGFTEVFQTNLFSYFWLIRKCISLASTMKVLQKYKKGSYGFTTICVDSYTPNTQRGEP